jgi:hypothetical protein
MSTKSTRKPVFILSLDLELLWGLIGTRSYKSIDLLKSAGGTRLRECINFLIDVLEKYRIQATWAVVGHLLVDPCNKEKYLTLETGSGTCTHSLNIHTPSYNSALYFGRDILERILSSTVEHEIAFHSFSHAIFLKIGKEVAELEIKAGVEIAKQFGISFKSFVFPQDKIGHTDVLKKYGFIIYRGETPRFNKLRARALHKVDGLVNEIIAPPVVPKWKDGIWEIQSSMHFCDPKYPFSLLPRAKLGLWRAMRSNMVFHIWLHPWNLLEYKSLSWDFERFIEYVCKKRNEGKITVMTMGNFAVCLNKTYSMDTDVERAL